MAYFTLYIRDEGGWCPQFGDHDRDVVAVEARDMVDSDRRERGGDAISMKDTRIIRFPRVPSQRQTMAKAAELGA